MEILKERLNKYNMKKGNKFEEYVLKIVDKYKADLGLTASKIEIKNDDKQQYLALEYFYPYSTHTILYNSKIIKYFETGKNLEEQIVHELIHIITDPLYTKAVARYVGKEEIEDEREALTDKIAVIVYKLKNK